MEKNNKNTISVVEKDLTCKDIENINAAIKNGEHLITVKEVKEDARKKLREIKNAPVSAKVKEFKKNLTTLLEALEYYNNNAFVLWDVINDSMSILDLEKNKIISCERKF